MVTASVCPHRAIRIPIAVPGLGPDTGVAARLPLAGPGLAIV